MAEKAEIEEALKDRIASLKEEIDSLQAGLSAIQGKSTSATAKSATTTSAPARKRGRPAGSKNRRRGGRKPAAANAPSGKRQQQFMTAVEKNPGMTAAEISSKIGVSKPHAYALAKVMKDRKLVRTEKSKYFPANADSAPAEKPAAKKPAAKKTPAKKPAAKKPAAKK